MEVGMGDVIMEEGEPQQWRSEPRSFGDQQGEEGMDLTELSSRARELASRAADWIAANPFAALGIAVGSGFFIGRAMRMWALRP